MWLQSISMKKMPKPLADIIDRLSYSAVMKRLGMRIAVAFSLFFLILDVALYVFGARPAAMELEQKRTRYAELKKRQAEAMLFQKQKATVAGIRAGIPTQKDMPILVRDMVQAAKKHGLSVADVNYDISKRDASGLTMLSFSFPATGSYPGIRRFIYEIEMSDRLVGIKEMSLEAERGKVKLDMKLVTYIKGG